MPESPLIEIDHSSDIPIWVQLRNRIAYLINAGHFQPGDRLPTVRELAAEASVNYNTVNKAYQGLVQDGFITSIRGKGAYVNNLDLEEGQIQDERLMKVVDDCISACRDLGLSLNEIDQSVTLKIRQMEHEEGLL